MAAITIFITAYSFIIYLRWLRHYALILFTHYYWWARHDDSAMLRHAADVLSAITLFFHCCRYFITPLIFIYWFSPLRCHYFFITIPLFAPHAADIFDAIFDAPLRHYAYYAYCWYAAIIALRHFDAAIGLFSPLTLQHFHFDWLLCRFICHRYADAFDWYSYVFQRSVIFFLIVFPVFYNSLFGIWFFQLSLLPPFLIVVCHAFFFHFIFFRLSGFLRYFQISLSSTPNTFDAEHCWFSHCIDGWGWYGLLLIIVSLLPLPLVYLRHYAYWYFIYAAVIGLFTPLRSLITPHYYIAYCIIFWLRLRHWYFYAYALLFIYFRLLMILPDIFITFYVAPPFTRYYEATPTIFFAFDDMPPHGCRHDAIIFSRRRRHHSPPPLLMMLYYWLCFSCRFRFSPPCRRCRCHRLINDISLCRLFHAAYCLFRYFFSYFVCHYYSHLFDADMFNIDAIIITTLFLSPLTPMPLVTLLRAPLLFYAMIFILFIIFYWYAAITFDVFRHYALLFIDYFLFHLSLWFDVCQAFCSFCYCRLPAFAITPTKPLIRHYCHIITPCHAIIFTLRYAERHYIYYVTITLPMPLRWCFIIFLY